MPAVAYAIPSHGPNAITPTSVRSGRGNMRNAAGVYASTRTSGAHFVSRTLRAQATMRSAVMNSETGVKRQRTPRTTRTAAAARILPQAGCLRRLAGVEKLVEPRGKVDAHEDRAAREGRSRRDLDAAIRTVERRGRDAGPRAVG